MDEPFGPRFFRWWAGLRRTTRYAIALLMLSVAAVMLFVCGFEAGFGWIPFLIAGFVMIVFAD